MTTPFPFTTGQVLTAAQMNAITTLPINDQTASYTLVVGDVGKRVIMNNAGATTITVNNSVFGVGDTIFIANKGAGSTTVTAGAGVTINSASDLVLPQYQSGQLVALSASSFLFFQSDVTASAGALTFISSTTIGTTVSSVTVSNVFSSTYDNYMVQANFQTISSAGTLIGLQLGSTTTGYYGSAINVPVNTGTPGGVGNNNTASFLAFSVGETNRCTFTAFINQPNLARQTQVTCLGSDAGRIAYSGSEVSTTQHTAFTLTPATGTLTGGTIRVFGIANS